MARRTPVTRVRIALAVGAAAMSALLISSASAVGGEVADGAVAQATPTITASPSTDLAAGQTVTITGSGFTPNQSIGVSQCEDPFVDSSSCDFATAKIANSDGSGGFTMSYTVVDTIKGTHSCVPTGCLLGAANLNTANEFGNRVSLTFADGSTPPTTDGSTPTTTPPGTDPDGSDDADIAGADGTSSALAKTGASDMLPYLVAGGVLLVAAGVVVTRRARSASR
jgi:LPXTG-motif cell wall-anchored protein